MPTLNINAKFSPGSIYATAGVLKSMKPDYATAALAQHLQGQWGLLDDEDKETNEFALKHGGRLMSVYPLPDKDENFWIITDGKGKERTTTFLLPSEY